MQDNRLIEKLNEVTDGKYSYLRLKSIEVKKPSYAAAAGQCVVTYMYPESLGAMQDDDMTDVAEITKRLLELKGAAEVLFKKSHIDNDFLRADVFRFMSESPAIGFLLDENDIGIMQHPDAVDINIRLFGAVFDYAQKSSLKQKLYDYLNQNYCAMFKIDFAKKDGEIEAAPRDEATIYKAFGGKTVRIQEVEKFLGNIVAEPPRRIIDVKEPGNNITVCGTIKFINKYDIKKGKNPQGRHVFNYTIEDYSGKIKIVYFSRPETDQRADTLITGTKIAVRGNVERDEYQGQSRLVMFAYDISLCEILPDLPEKIVKAPAPKSYKTVFPVSVSTIEQDDFLTEKTETNDLLKHNSFVVFDVETTGLGVNDKIIELSGVKIEGGLITEHFSTLVDPEMLIPAASTKVNLITNQMVADAPKIEQVIGDFYKFCENCALVAHNIDFDHAFITRAGAEDHYIFDHKQYDTYQLARQYIPNLSNYTLTSTCRYFGIINETAHRALSDSIATAKAFIKLTDIVEARKQAAAATAATAAGKD